MNSTLTSKKAPKRQRLLFQDALGDVHELQDGRTLGSYGGLAPRRTLGCLPACTEAGWL